jgi:mono/diheme cytochrome c family protein
MTAGCLALGASPDPATLPVTAQQAAFFETRIRPVLAENCFACHGPAKQKLGLRLDSRPALLKGSENGPVVLPGDVENSLLVQVIRWGGATKMPPKGQLTPQAIADLTAWVKVGLPWPESKPVGSGGTREAWKRHWAFQPTRSPPPPVVADPSWPRTSIDRFILASLENKGLTPSPTADRRTLLRRVSFDLIGLPPSPEEIAEFETDVAPDAYARVVERLLASPHYGERWGRHWLDVARYADTKGYVFFEEANFPWAYTYRDFVIRAFNDNLPYNRFITQQLAADRLSLGSDRRPLTALGFLTLGGRFMNNLQDILDDRIDTVTRGLLGLTVSCARCHDHKFDPISSKDYYSLYGVFASCTEPTVPPLYADPPQTREYVAFAKELRTREEKLTRFVQTKHREMVQSARTRVAEYLLAARTLQNQPTTEEFMLLADGGDLNPRMVTRWRVYLDRTRRGRHPVFALWHALAALPEKDFAKHAPSITKRMCTPQDPDQRINPTLAQAFLQRPVQSMADAARRYAEILLAVDRQWQAAVEQAEQARVQAPTALPAASLEELRQVFYGPDSPPNVAMNPVGDLELLPDRPAQATLQELRKAVETWRATGHGAPPRAMVLEDSATPCRPRVFRRGNPNSPGEEVPRRFLEFLAGEKAQPFTDGSGRLELARAIVDRANPLTARVWVNRVWLHHFGTGLVRTPSDFGLRSDPPTHPELLDYLASYLMNHGWSLKDLHRLILLSATYQQRSDDRSEGHKIDPENALLWRSNRRRLDFEATRDALLAAASMLDRRIGGPSVANVTASGFNRRTLYGFLDRLNLPALLRTFDFPNPDATSPQRTGTTVAPQALYFMNNPFVQTMARGVIRRPHIREETDLTRRVRRLYLLLYSRTPTVEEVSLARAYLDETRFREVSWERYAQALLVANEFVFVD